MDVDSEHFATKGYMDFDQFVDTYGINPLDLEEISWAEANTKEGKAHRKAFSKGLVVSVMEDDNGRTYEVAVGWRLVNVLHRTIMPFRVYGKDESGHLDFIDPPAKVETPSEVMMRMRALDDQSFDLDRLSNGVNGQ